uniref:Uncharacterized protein n=1 Tax=Percolomonas cosmopolitus TaxID=63605 RepID=A0A7S1KPF4_9EUKA|mmetsp:Transcript_2961/g.11315  ORF Transcript_2961/g.11315 Transcript_2961/m.11315 type:complete len:749 (+) Transcript_2961:395-2641(+)|eukprot:CAMPEP_0117451270 /NCGR_PEP_ID=MMETSP0759-20121206/8917_1 /TAXON_ID=63605 /ORGANISM="Percolomonas cosmopolitus, Strain WS" /LENGTH=748 /DNA_ID=CAMNT_0005243857 /DNA_START=289 /DNA_END=2535 /DNA_ORIENTATION=+
MGSAASRDPKRETSPAGSSLGSSTIYVSDKEMSSSSLSMVSLTKKSQQKKRTHNKANAEDRIKVTRDHKTSNGEPSDRLDDRIRHWRTKYEQEIAHMLRECEVDDDYLEESVRELAEYVPFIHKYSINFAAASNVLQLHLSISNTSDYNTLVSMFQYLYLLIYLDANENLRLMFPDVQQEFCVVDLAPYTEELLNNACNCIQLYFIDEQGGDQHVITKNILLDYSGELADALTFQVDSHSVGSGLGKSARTSSNDTASSAAGQDKSALEKSMLVIKNILTVRNPTPHFAFYEMGRILMKLNRFDESEQCFRMEIQKGCSDSKIFAYNSMGTLLKKMQQVPQAISYLTRAIQLRPNYFEALLTLSTILCVGPMHGYIDWKHLLARSFCLRPDDPLFLHLFVSLKEMQGQQSDNDDEDDSDFEDSDDQSSILQDFSVEEIIDLAREMNLSEPLKLRTQQDFPSSTPVQVVDAVGVAPPKSEQQTTITKVVTERTASNKSLGKLARTFSMSNQNSATLVITNIPQNLEMLSVNETEASLENFSQSANQNLVAITNLPTGSNLIIRLVFKDNLTISMSILLNKKQDSQEFFYEYHPETQQIQRSTARINDVPQENMVQYPSQDFDTLMNDPLIRDIMNSNNVAHTEKQDSSSSGLIMASDDVRSALDKAFAELKNSISDSSAVAAYADALESLSSADWLDDKKGAEMVDLIVGHIDALPEIKSVGAFHAHFEIVKESLPSAQRKNLDAALQK